MARKKPLPITWTEGMGRPDVVIIAVLVLVAIVAAIVSILAARGG